jgi:tRNA-splicing ligase RtcB
VGNILKIFGRHDDNTLKQLQDVANRAEAVALMADGHLGYVMPIGGVAAYQNKVSPVGVGFDIACGNAALLTDLTLEGLTDGRLGAESLQVNPYSVMTNPRLNELADEIANSISFGIGRKNTADDAPVDNLLFNHPAWGAVPNDKHKGWFRDELREKARRQLGTVGSGNHYVDVFSDTAGRIWVGVHFGSRGLGHTIASSYLAISQGGNWGDRAKEVEILLDLSTPMGDEYWQLMELAGQYAYAGREWVARKVTQILGGTELDLVHNHHNFAWKETHTIPAGQDEHGNFFDYEEREVVVIRKGATPAFPGQRGFVGGSMGDDSVILQGVNLTPQFDKLPEIRSAQRLALYSTVHGAGRVMSRTQAAGKRDRRTGQLKMDKDGKVINAGLISPQMMSRWLREKGVVLRGGGQDEAPQAYRRLTDVLQSQEPTIEVLETLSPLIVCMAGANEIDPYKD